MQGDAPRPGSPKFEKITDRKTQNTLILRLILSSHLATIHPESNDACRYQGLAFQSEWALTIEFSLKEDRYEKI
jgi:hypothetical protein